MLEDDVGRVAEDLLDPLGEAAVRGLVDRGFAELINNKEENVKILVSPKGVLA